MTLHASCFQATRTHENKKEIPKALRGAAAAIDAQRSPGTAGQPEITQGTSTPRARAAGQPYRSGLTGELTIDATRLDV